jgi:hypothetical protein
VLASLDTGGQFPVRALERSRWRDGRFACYALCVMPQRSAFNSDFRFSLFFLSQAKSIDYRGKKIQFP